MKVADIKESIDLNYINGFIECACGWRKELGNGFNGYKIANCPNCTPGLETRYQSQVTTGSKGSYTVKHGRFGYFVLSNGLHIQFSAQVFRTEQKGRL